MMKFSLEPETFWSLLIFIAVFSICLVYGVIQIINRYCQLEDENKALKKELRKKSGSLDSSELENRSESSHRAA